ncbi:Trm112 family protein [Candidatus Lokiarchaeum ossiferum]|uniref:Trm112 family protein n=1 Tax=Candidatus Lokiarchaeum ossiferum TaxID=2951803 RepID=UPI00352EA42C
MKLWLLEILACPIDKAYPLSLTILKWKSEELSPNPLEILIKGYQEKNVLKLNEATPVKKEVRENGELFVNDLLVLKPTRFDHYLEQLLTGIEELSNVQDKSSWATLQALELVKTEIKTKLNTALNSLTASEPADPDKIFQSILTQLEFLNIFKYEFEIEDAVIQCHECKRWFPVFENIPQMLPDNVRDPELDQQFLEKWSHKISF